MRPHGLLFTLRDMINGQYAMATFCGSTGIGSMSTIAAVALSNPMPSLTRTVRSRQLYSRLGRQCWIYIGEVPPHKIEISAAKMLEGLDETIARLSGSDKFKAACENLKAERLRFASLPPDHSVRFNRRTPA